MAAAKNGCLFFNANGNIVVIDKSTHSCYLEEATESQTDTQVQGIYVWYLQ